MLSARFCRGEILTLLQSMNVEMLKQSNFERLVFYIASSKREKGCANQK